MERNLRKTRVGTVVSDKMDKTIVVAHRRPCHDHGDPPLVQGQELAPGQNHREGEISLLL